MNFQAVVSQFFEWETSLVFRWPLPFLIIPPLFTVGIVCLTISDFELNTTNDTLQVFLPDTMESLTDLKELMYLFPPSDAQRDSYSIFGSKFAYIVLENPHGNVISIDNIQKLSRLHRMVMSVKTVDGLSFKDICMKESEEDECTLHPLAYAIEDDDPMLGVQFLLRYPVLKLGDLSIDNAVVFGGVTVNEQSRDTFGNAAITNASAIRIVYVMDSTNKTDSWIDKFLTEIADYKVENGTKIYWSSSKSLANEMERNGQLLIPWMPWTALVLIIFCMVVCSSTDPVKSQPLVGFFAMLNASMATVASTSILLYLRYPFLPLVFIMPFLVVAVGTDNMFIILKSWRMTSGPDFEKRFVSALTETSASLFLTSLTDGLSFSIGSIAEFYAVRVFCTYCALAILLMFLFQVTFFSAMMLLCCRRELAGRYSILCCLGNKKSSKKLLNISSFASRPLPSLPSGRWIVYLPRMFKTIPVQIAVFIFYIVYLVVSLNYTLCFPLGLDLKLLAPDGSYVADELLVQERLFNDFGSFCFAVVKEKNLSDRIVRNDLLQLYEQLTSSQYASKGEFWLEDFEKFYHGKDDIPEEFMSNLHTFLANPKYRKYRNDIRFSLDGQIEAMKIIMRVRQLGSANDEPRATILRNIMKSSGYNGFVYDTSFLLVDQQFSTVSNVIINVVSAIATMLGICVLMVPRPVSSCCIAVSILSINIGVVGALSAVSTRLDIISMITIVMSIGFSVDYVTHTTFHYVIQRGNRLEKCLLVMTEPILQSAISTAVGVSLLIFVPSYIILYSIETCMFRPARWVTVACLLLAFFAGKGAGSPVSTFVYTVFFVVLIGVLHGLIFLPVLLDVVVPYSEYIESYSDESHHNSTSQQFSRDHMVYSIPFKKKINLV